MKDRCATRPIEPQTRFVPDSSPDVMVRSWRMFCYGYVLEAPESARVLQAVLHGECHVGL